MKNLTEKNRSCFDFLGLTLFFTIMLPNFIRFAVPSTAGRL